MTKMTRKHRRALKIRGSVQDCVRTIQFQKDAQERLCVSAQNRADAIGREVAASPDLAKTDSHALDAKLNAFDRCNDQIKRVKKLVKVLRDVENSLFDLLLQLDSMIELGLHKEIVRVVPVRKICRLIRSERLALLDEIHGLLSKTRERVCNVLLEEREAHNRAQKEKEHIDEVAETAEDMIGDASRSRMEEARAEILKKYGKGNNGTPR